MGAEAARENPVTRHPGLDYIPIRLARPGFSMKLRRPEVEETQ
jgi:hypothetical protein